MKRNMPTFINVISESKFEILEEIIDSKYSQFTTFYWLLRNYSDSITKLKYKESKKKNTLKIDISLSNIKLDTVIKEINKCLEKEDIDNDITLVKEGKVIHVEITKPGEE